MNKKKYVKNLLLRVLLSIILFLGISIFVNYSNDNLLLFKNNFYDKTLKFNKISNWYEKHFGKVINKPSPEKITTVNKELSYSSAYPYMEGVKLKDVDVVYPFKSGIVVFIGEKENYGNTIIIQGMDGIDYWYSNIENVGIKLYDYVESDSIIGEAKDKELLLIFMKDNKVLNYQDYISTK